MFFVNKIGYLAIAYWSCRIYREVYKRIYMVFFTSKCPIDVKSMGKWCMVTGCSQGIGRAYVEALARQQMCIILLDFPSEKLNKLAEDIENTHNVETKVIELDPLREHIDYASIEEELSDYEIGVLINNLSVSPPHPDYFLDSNLNDNIYNDIIQCNILTFTNICQLLLPLMVERQRGVIVNVASTFAIVPSPLMAVFAASKAYVLKFSKDLAVEYKEHGIIVQCLCPGSITTNACASFEGWLTPSPKKYVESAINTIGKDTVTTGFYPHTILIAFLRFVHRLSPDTLIKWMTKFMRRNRQRAFRRKNDDNSP